VFPRFFLAHDVRPETSPGEALMESLNMADFNHNVVLVDKEAWGTKTLSEDVDSSLADAVSIVSYDTRKGAAALDITSSREQLLIVSENYNDGWKALVNDTPTPVFTANYYAKGICVPQGKVRVILTYNSPSAAFWKKVTAVSAVLFGFFALFVFILHYRKKYRPDPSPNR
jgi:uncharacterized membrane protein YfhO